MKMKENKWKIIFKEILLGVLFFGNTWFKMVMGIFIIYLFFSIANPQFSFIEVIIVGFELTLGLACYLLYPLFIELEGK